MENELIEVLERIKEDLRIAFIHDEGFELSAEEVDSILQFMELFL